MTWSLEAYCEAQEALLKRNIPPLVASSQAFMDALQLPSLHPFCDDPSLFTSGTDPHIPPMGPLRHQEFHRHWGDVILTNAYRVLPALLAMGELWLRLFASALAPLGVTYLLWEFLHPSTTSTQKGPSSRNNPQHQSRFLSLTVLVTVASAVVLLTDTLFVLHHGPKVGATWLTLALLVAIPTCRRHQLHRTLIGVGLLIWLACFLVWDTKSSTVSFGSADDAVTHVTEGLYFDASHEPVTRIVEEWPQQHWTYTPDVATPWMPTGDARTGIPFLLNKVPAKPTYSRVWLETEDQEYVALDVAFPSNGQGHNTSKPVYLVLHGLNGGSHEEYVMEFAWRRQAEGSTVVVLVARGLMDLPLKGWNLFHGARTMDVHSAARTVRKAMEALHRQHESCRSTPRPVLAGVGYSMGAIVLSNYVTRYGSDVGLDAAIAISGGLDMRFEEHFYRAQRLWQPMLAQELRDTFLVNKWGERVRARLTTHELQRTMRAVHVTEIDTYAVATYHRFDNLTHYYMEMSALGDFSLEEYHQQPTNNARQQRKRLHSLSIPLCVVHALDDPLVTWKAVAANKGLMHPTQLTKDETGGSSNLLVLLTKGGGHVGWPLGWLPFVDKWKWMNDAAMTFVEAVHRTRSKVNESQQCGA